MEEVLRTILDNLLDNKQAITIKHRQEDGKDIYTVKVDPKEEGVLIGRQGRMAKSIKILIKALGAKEGKRVELELP